LKCSERRPCCCGFHQCCSQKRLGQKFQNPLAG
jgi:hypothetical protein